MGLLGTVLALLGAANALSTLTDRRHANELGIGIFSLLVGVVAVACTVPTGMEPRFALPAIAALVYFTAQGACWIVQNPSTVYPAVLVVSDGPGEGMFVAEMAKLRSSAESISIRGTKALADVNWTGRDYKTSYTTPRAVLKRVDQLPVAYVVDDRSVSSRSVFPHQVTLQQAITDYPEYFQLLGTFSMSRDGLQQRDSVYLYGFLHSTPPSRVLHLPMPRTLHSEIQVIVPEAKKGSGDSRRNLSYRTLR